jgi:probable H4MPT-linked C1 transfer pathway protein
MHAVLGLDIGGANLKAAHLDGTARSLAFPLWKAPGELATALARLIQVMPGFDSLAVTMTGELCDCFATRREGVLAILDAVQAVAQEKPVRVWQTTGRFVDVASARLTPLLTAAANWHALAAYACRFAPSGSAVLLDIGSTTTDILPLCDGKVVAAGKTDTERLRRCELVYTGVKRTPVCALLGSAVLAEFFATSGDVYLLLGDSDESEDCDTADGRPATKAGAHGRLARMLGGDAETCALDEVQVLARKARAVQMAMIGHALRQVARTLPGMPIRWILSGTGEFLARLVLRSQHIPEEDWLSLTGQHGSSISAAACAYALAVLAHEGQHG